MQTYEHIQTSPDSETVTASCSGWKRAQWRIGKRWSAAKYGLPRNCCCRPKNIRCRRLRWLGHLSRMDHHRLPRQALTWEPEGFRRRPGRPRQNWKDVIKKISGKWASAGARLKRLRRTGGAGGIVSPNASWTWDEPGTRPKVVQSEASWITWSLRSPGLQSIRTDSIHGSATQLHWDNFT